MLDECLPRKLKKELVEHDVSTVPEMGWAGKKNGELLKLAAAEFDVFLTADQNLAYQQKLETAGFGVIVLVTRDNRFESFKELIPKVLNLLNKGEVKGIIKID